MVKAIEFQSKEKQLVVHTDKECIAYHNVSEVAYMYFERSPNWAAYWKRYIDPVYLRVT